jgi:hypothetical protein
MKARIEGTKLIVEMDLISPPRPSASGKTLVVATSSGNQATTAIIDGKPVVIGFNAYVKK